MYVPYQLVANNRSVSSCPFGLDLTGRTWLVSFLLSRVQNLHGTLGRCLFGAFPEVAKPIFASPPVSPPAKQAKTKVVKYPHCMYLAILSQQNGQDLLPNYLVNGFRLSSSSRELPKAKRGQKFMGKVGWKFPKFPFYLLSGEIIKRY